MAQSLLKAQSISSYYEIAKLYCYWVKCEKRRWMVFFNLNIRGLDIIDCQFQLWQLIWQLIEIVIGIGAWQIIATIDCFFSNKK